jgi:hypothetical protein
MSRESLPAPPRQLLEPSLTTHLMLVVTPPRLLTALVAIGSGVALPFTLKRVEPLYAALGALPFIAGGVLLLALTLRRLLRERRLLRHGQPAPVTVEAVRRSGGLSALSLALEDGTRIEHKLMPRPLRPTRDGGFEVDGALAGRLLRFDSGASRDPLELTALVDPKDPTTLALPRLLGARFAGHDE